MMLLLLFVQVVMMNMNLIGEKDSPTDGNKVCFMADTEITPTPAVAENLVAKISRVRYYTFQKAGEEFERKNVELTIDKKVKAFVFNNETKLFEEIETNKLNISAARLIELALVNEVAAMFISTVDDPNTQKVFGMMFSGATINVNNVFHAKGEVIDDVALERDKWYTDIVGYVPGELNVKLMFKAIENI